MDENPMEQMIPTYDAYMRRVTLGREQALRETTVKLARIQPGDCVLEVGCGTGTLTLAAKRQAGPSGKVFGIDVLPGMVEYSQRKAAQANADVTFQVGSIDEIPFPENQFDVVMCSFMIFHMGDETRRKGLGEIYRVLRPTGRLLVLDLALPPQRLQRGLAKRIFGGMLEHDLHELLLPMEASGFSAIEIGSAPFHILGLSILGFVRGSASKAQASTTRK
jgi:ubiquinone/menaquinone biosynthesis C-methylase UbiE